MTEKKTFKNPKLVTGWEDGVIAWHSISEYPSPGKFLVDEWDMEVTFTKKAPKPEVGGTCRTKYSDQLAIMGVNGSWIWVAEDPEDPGWVVDVDDLMDVKPWQPA